MKKKKKETNISYDIYKVCSTKTLEMGKDKLRKTKDTTVDTNRGVQVRVSKQKHV